ncbi:hypothetical protein GGR51DRAFT_570630 [Nemania sp. FL0031]|nr:hypothetical protein GGR51DRAFT_570630 [Nemania sp. FL0031]
MAILTSTGVLIDMTARRVPTTSLSLRPASDIEILGIATATCLLAIFLCSVLWAGARVLRCAYSPKLDRSDTSHITTTSDIRAGATLSVRKWSSIPSSRSQDSSSGQQRGSQTPRFTNATSNKRMKIPWKNHVITKQYYYTQMVPRCKPASRKPLLFSNPRMTSIRWKDTTLDMEEGLSLRSNAAAITNGHDDFPCLKRVALCRESKEKDAGDLNNSFLPGRVASL